MGLFKDVDPKLTTPKKQKKHKMKNKDKFSGLVSEAFKDGMKILK